MQPSLMPVRSDQESALHFEIPLWLTMLKELARNFEV
jgi:hypothetical protein